MVRCRKPPHILGIAVRVAAIGEVENDQRPAGCENPPRLAHMVLDQGKARLHEIGNDVRRQNEVE